MKQLSVHGNHNLTSQLADFFDKQTPDEIHQRQTSLLELDETCSVHRLKTKLCETSDDYIKQIDDTRFEKYWSAIEPLSFKSVFVTLADDEVAALQIAHTVEKNIDDETAEKIRALSTKIDEEKKRLGLSPDSDIFVRLSTRSPKDAVTHQEKFTTELDVNLRNITTCHTKAYESAGQKYTTEQIHFNALMHALYQTSTQLLAVKKGQEAAELLTQSVRIPILRTVFN